MVVRHYAHQGCLDSDLEIEHTRIGVHTFESQSQLTRVPAAVSDI